MKVWVVVVREAVRSTELLSPSTGLGDDISIQDIITIMSDGSAVIDIPPTLAADPLSHNLTSQYDLTATRGRALLLSNKAEIRDVHGRVTNWRKGSQNDHQNMKCMLEKFGFVTAGEHKNYTAQEIVEAIHRETQLIDEQTGESIYKHLSMFVLLITSHGSKGTVAGSDHKLIELTDIYKLLSAANFPAMKGKAKLIIIQACAGSDRDMMLDQIPATSHQVTHHAAVTPSRPHIGQQQTHISDIPDVDSGDNTTLSTADLFIMQSSFDSFVSPRSELLGSPFIRALVITFYKHAHRYPMTQLAQIVHKLPASKFGVVFTCVKCKVTPNNPNIQEAVSKSSVERTLLYRQQTTRAAAYVGQMPKVTCTLTGIRDLYLRPGVNMRTVTQHPTQIVHPKYPTPTKTCTIWSPDEVKQEWGEGDNTVRETRRLMWQIKKVRPVPARRPVPAPRRRAV